MVELDDIDENFKWSYEIYQSKIDELQEKLSKREDQLELLYDWIINETTAGIEVKEETDIKLAFIKSLFTKKGRVRKL